jgi:KTSC domain
VPGFAAQHGQVSLGEEKEPVDMQNSEQTSSGEKRELRAINKQGVVGAGYDAASQTLRVEFARGVRYEYRQVPEAVFDWLCRTSEPGGYVRRILTPRYAYRVLPSVGAPEPDLAALLRASLEQLLREHGIE